MFLARPIAIISPEWGQAMGIMLAEPVPTVSRKAVKDEPGEEELIRKNTGILQNMLKEVAKSIVDITLKDTIATPVTLQADTDIKAIA